MGPSARPILSDAMPTYEYECSTGHRFEVIQKMSDDPVAECPECGAAAQRKISGGAGFLFKGDGFYITDYRSDDYKKKASADRGDASSTSSSSSDSASSGSDSGSKGSGSSSSDGGSASSGSTGGSGTSSGSSDG